MDAIIKNRAVPWIIVILVVVNLMTLSTLWFFVLRRPLHPPAKSGENGKKLVELFMAKELNLTEEQARRFDQLQEQHFRRSDPIIEDIHRLREELFHQLVFSSDESARARELAQEIGERETEKELLLFRHFTELLSTLRPEQQNDFKRLIHEILRKIAPPPPPDRR